MPVPWKSTIRRQESSYGPPSQDVLDNFQLFYDAITFPEATESFANVLSALDLDPGPFHIFFPKLKNRLQRHLPYKFRNIWSILEKKVETWNIWKWHSFKLQRACCWCRALWVKECN